MEILGLIPARGGSKGIPKKNIHPLGGKPLIAHTIEAAKQSRLLTRCILSSDSGEIIRVAAEYGLEAPFTRPAELSGDNAPALPFIQHAVRWLEDNGQYRADVIVLLQPTSPLRTARHIDEAVEKLLDSDADSIVSVVQVPHNCNPYSVMRLENGRLSPFLEYDEKNNLRQRKPVFYARNGAAIYAFTRECLLEKNSIYGDTILAYEMAPKESVDIDSAFDLELCEWLLERKKDDS